MVNDSKKRIITRTSTAGIDTQDLMKQHINVKKRENKKALSTSKGEGTTYSCLFSTVRQQSGTTYSLVKDQIREFARRKSKAED